MKENKAEIGGETINVTVTLQGEEALAFKSSAEKSGRSYRSEARIRMIDHVKRYSSLTCVGDCVARKVSS